MSTLVVARACPSPTSPVPMPKGAVGKKGKSKGKAAGGKQSGTAAPASVFVWAQCDNAGCQKWRKLPPASIIEDDVPW